jgi:O-antigen/teichoic acid export membrane protein
MSVNRNIAAGFLGNTWAALVQIAFVPLYVHILGIEAFGLIGVFTFLQVLLSILDLGLIPTISREAARFRAGAHSVGEIRTLLRSVEVVFLAVALALFVAVAAAAPWLAGSWLNAETLPVTAAVRAIYVMGALVGLRWLSGLYRGAITGMQDLVWLNLAGAFFATLRGAGVVPVLIWISPTIEAFFVYQVVITLLELALLYRRSWSLFPSRDNASFSARALGRIWRFSTGMTIITSLYLLLTQSDKMLLSTMLSLKAFGYYALASSVAGSLNLLVAPIGSVAYPRLNELVARGDPAALAETYHRFAQMQTLAIAPGALVLAIFSDHILTLWTQDATTSGETAPLVTLLAIGAMLNAFMSTPHMLQLAYGRTRLIIALNAAYVLVFVPAIYFGVSAYGAIASGYAWIAINASGIIFGVPLMHRNALPREKWRWYVNDVALPSGAALGAACLVRLAAPAPVLHDNWMLAVVVSAALLLANCAAVSVSPVGRRMLTQGWSFLSGPPS